MPETKYDLVALVKKLRPDLNFEHKPSLPTRTHLTLSTFVQLEQSDTPVANSSNEDGHKKGVFCYYCEKDGHKEAKGPKKSRDAKQPEEVRPNTTGAQIATVNDSGLGHCNPKNKNSGR